MNKKNRQDKLTLVAIFIATYVAIFFGFYEKITLSSTDKAGLFEGLGYMMLVVFSAVIVIIFFLYLVFTALGLTSNKKKEIILDQEISDIKIEKTKNFLFNAGVKLIFFSFTYPIYYLFILFNSAWNTWIAIILFFFFLCFLLIDILLHILFAND